MRLIELSLNDSQKIKVAYLSAAEILAIHDRIIEVIGGIHGVRDENSLQSVAVRPQTAYGGSDMFPDLFSKAASYLEGISGFHPFSDGNKRTSITVAAAFLGRNGYEVILPIEEAESFIIAVAQKQKTTSEVAAWLKKHSRKI